MGGKVLDFDDDSSVPEDSDRYEGSAPREAEEAPGGVQPARSYVGILFDCCGVYVRVYRRPDQNLYTGRCPNCLRAVKIRVGPEGTQSRIFRAL